MSTLQTAIGEPLRASPRWPKLAALMNLPKAGVVARVACGLTARFVLAAFLFLRIVSTLLQLASDTVSSAIYRAGTPLATWITVPSDLALSFQPIATV